MENECRHCLAQLRSELNGDQENEERKTRVDFLQLFETGFNLIENPPALHDAKAEGNDFRGEEEVDYLQGDQ